MTIVNERLIKSFILLGILVLGRITMKIAHLYYSTISKVRNEDT